MRLALGTAQFGIRYGIYNSTGKVTQKEGKAILKHAAFAGINTIDTAVIYGDSELVLGKIGVQDFEVITKLPEIPEHITDIEGWVIKTITESVSRLGIDRLYGLLLHRPSQLLTSKGVKILAALRSLKESAIVKKLGVSVTSPSEFDALFAVYDFDVVQCPLNLVDRRLVNSGWLKKLNALGVEIHTRSIFLQGLLLMPRHTIPSKFNAWNNLWDNWDRWLRVMKISPIDACLSYVLSFSDIDKVVVGVETHLQLEEIIKAASNNSINSYPDINSDVDDLTNPTNWNIL